jgi:hypothetical protein
MPPSNDSRYQDILRRIQQRKQEQASVSTHDDLANVLDAVNAWGYLEEAKESGLRQINCFGPKVVRKPVFKKETPWVGVVVWHKPRGYHHYRTLDLLGIWALENTGALHLTIGTRTLEFAAPVFNPESYYRWIQQGFDVYYEDDGCPPPESGRVYTVQYQAEQRLAIRNAIVGELAKWAERYK